MAKVVRKIILATVAVAALTGAGKSGWEWWTTGRFVQSTDDAYLHSDITAISAKIAGYVKTVAVGDNQQVEAGDVLVVIEDRDAKVQLDQAKAAIEVAQAVIAGIDTRLQLQKGMIAQASAALSGAEAEFHRSSQDYKRIRTLNSASWASRQKLDTAEADYQKSQALLQKAQAALVTERDQIFVLEASRREQEARMRQAEVQLHQAQNDVENTIIRAPVGGVIGNRGVRPGLYARPGVQLMSLVPLPSVYVAANFKETQIARMRVGQPVVIKVDAWPEKPLMGQVESFAPASGSQFSLLPPENATGNFTKIVQRVPVRISVPDDNMLAGLLRPGLSVVVEVDTRDAAPHAVQVAVQGVTFSIFGVARAATPSNEAP
ncbi:membrane fusion protein, multidrug efflux system [Azospirillaceae bacterium]